MAKKVKYRKDELSEFHDYLENKLSGKDRNAFERRLEKDPFFADALEGFSTISGEEAEQDLERLGVRIDRRIKRKRRIAWYSAAAAVASILIVTTIYFNLGDTRIDKYESLPEMREAGKEQPALVQEEKTHPAKTNTEPGAEESAEENLPIQSGAKTEDRPVTRVVEKGSKGREGAGIPLSPSAAEKGETPDLSASEQNVQAEQNDAIEYFFEKEESDAEISLDKNVVTARPLPTQDAAPAAGTSRRESKKEAVRSPEEADGALPSAISFEVTSAAYDLPRQAYVSGVVRSAEDLQPLPGVSIIVKGTTLGTVSDMDGVFKLDTENVMDKTLVASYVGMEPEEFLAQNDQPLEIAMMPTNTSLDEVVVVAAGAKRMANEAATGQATDIDYDLITDYQSAAPMGGFPEFRAYIDSAMNLPPSLQIPDKALVVLKFVVQKNGSLSDFKVIRSPGQIFADEAIRLVKYGPSWAPATRDGETIEESVRLRISFR